LTRPCGDPAADKRKLTYVVALLSLALSLYTEMKHDSIPLPISHYAIYKFRHHALGRRLREFIFLTDKLQLEEIENKLRQILELAKRTPSFNVKG